MPWGIIPILKGESIQDRAGSTRRPRKRMVFEGIFWFCLVLPQAGSSGDAGSGDAAYNGELMVPKIHFLVFAEPRPGSRTPAWNWADSPTGVEGGAVFFRAEWSDISVSPFRPAGRRTIQASGLCYPVTGWPTSQPRRRVRVSGRRARRRRLFFAAGFRAAHTPRSAIVGCRRRPRPGSLETGWAPATC